MSTTSSRCGWQGSRMVNNDPMAKTQHRSIRVPDERWERALRVTREQDTNVAEVVNQALQDYIDEHDDEAGNSSE